MKISAQVAFSFCAALLTNGLLTLGCSTTDPKPTPSEVAGSEFLEDPSEKDQFNFKNDILIKVTPSSRIGFNFAYYLFLPAGVERQPCPILIVESNNTGRASDDIALHDQSARKITERGYLQRISKRFRFPMLVPVFPRPSSDWQTYVHYLNRRTLKIEEGPLKRVDLQLVAMIRDARSLLARSGIDIEPKIFMNGFSSSAGFALRFTALHPGLIKAVSAGGINALPVLPLKEWQKQNLPYPLGVGDLKDITGEDLDSKTYLQVPQKLYMGELDTNDTVPFRDAWNEQEAEFINRVFGEKMMPDRWHKTQKILKSTGAKVDLKTYSGVGHKVTPEIEEDIFRFFSLHR